MPEKLWGKVGYNQARDSWYVKGKWQGERLYYSTYQTVIGHKSCKTEREANQLQFLISAEMEKGVFNPLRYKPAKPHHVKKYAEAWLESVKPDLAHATWKAYKAAINYISEGLGDVYIRDLNYKAIKGWLSNLPLSLKTKKNYQGVLIGILKDALRNGDIDQLPQFVEFRGGWSIPSKKKEWVNKSEQLKILDEIPEADRFIFKFLFATGVRPSEARALRKKDIFKDRRNILIRVTFGPVPGGEELKPVKQKRERDNVFVLYPVAEAAPYGYFTKERYNYAWLHHQRRNPHHWQYWYLMQDNDPDFPLPMPKEYVLEMVADWAGAGRAITGKWDVSGWYAKNADKIKIDCYTRDIVETAISKLESETR